MLLYPAPGRRVRDPRTGSVIGVEGIEVGPHDYDLWWMRQHGDLVDDVPPAPAPEPVAAAPSPAPIAAPEPPAQFEAEAARLETPGAEEAH